MEAVYSNLSIMPLQPTTKDLLLASQLAPEVVASLLKPYGIYDTKKADANLQSIADDPNDRLLFAEILEESLKAFSTSPDPDQALNNFERFTQSTFSKTALLSFFQKSPRTLWQSAQIFGGSCFLSDILIRNPEYFYWVFDPEQLKQPKQKMALRKDLNNALHLRKEKAGQLDMLRIFKRKEILRIGVRDLIGVATIEETFRDLSNLADICIEGAYAICEKSLRKQYGLPRMGKDFARRPALCVIALGKLGSRELNFSSDVDLIYLYPSNEGETRGGKGKSVLQNRRYFEQLSKEITAALNAPTAEGYVYRVDLRLRPEGEKGLIALPLKTYRRYYEKRGETWERLVLLRARPVAGDCQLAKAFLEMATPFIYEKPFNHHALAEIKQFKGRIDSKIGLKNNLYRDVKRGYGGIREIEFVIQSLQLTYGRKDMDLRKAGTLTALKRLSEKGHVLNETSRCLANAYRFLRDVENKIQMVNDQQTHLLPTDPAQVHSLALRLGYRDTSSGTASDQLMSAHCFQTNRVHHIFNDFFSVE